MPLFSIRIKKRAKGEKAILAVVGKNLFKKATERNLLKRRIRAALSLIFKEYGIYDRQFIVFANRGSERLGYNQIEAELRRVTLTALK